ncbi:MAG: SpoIID/LytB domain-containing protein [Bacteroidetes bacterium]|nr:SpoIID/LytB domain-containing protein [Bacteroidota bacterium]MBU1116851.1 SpoIID/LytB domain-containing protein [Bacteroidota bacterium]MBU1798040.1 SpoIID/LytB domain-containing protein [Bacteroidota bacterium]
MKEPNVNVAIMANNEILFELYGEFECSCAKSKCSGKYTAKYENGIISITSNSETFVVANNTVFNAVNLYSDTFLLRNVLIGKDFHWQKKENQRFQGSLKFIIEKDVLTAVNVIPVESYLTSVISSEMNATSSHELLKAHSIISRSWLLAQMDKSVDIIASNQQYKSEIKTEDELVKWYDKEDHTLYDVCADDHCQRYQGMTKFHAHNAQEAVAQTRGMVLKYNDKICDARFSKSCGGISESFENVWEPVVHPYLQKIIDYKFAPEEYDLDLRKEKAATTWIKNNPPAYCNTTDEDVLAQVLVDYDRTTKDFYRWKVEYTQTEISELIKRKSQMDFGDIIDLIPIERGHSGRLIKLKIVGTKKTLIIGKELEIRKVLSKSHLYSSAFVVDKENVVDGIPQKFVLTGAGWGHGVGLCQIGAAVMGEKGFSFDVILLHYFKNSEIKRIYD